jgi:hypothetical protein
MMLGLYLRQHGLENKAKLLEAVVGWLKGDFPFLCPHGCRSSDSNVYTCEHGQPAIFNFLNPGTLRDAALLVALDKRGVQMGMGLKEIREWFGGQQ